MSQCQDYQLKELTRPVKAILRLNEVTRCYGNGYGIFDISLQLAEREVVALVGANGSGKSTVIRCASLFEQFEKGSVEVDKFRFGPIGAGSSANEPNKTNAVRGHLVGTVFQDSRPWPHLSVLENVLLPLTLTLGLSQQSAKERAAAALKQFDLMERASSKPYQLSGGLKQRVVLARVFALQPRVLLVDEGTSALDPDWTERVRAILRAYADSGASVGIVSHQMGFVQRVADTVVFLHRGRIHETGDPQQIFFAPRTEELQRFLANA